MITNKLKYIFALSIPLFIAHGIEEYFTGFYNLDQWDEWIFGLLPFVSIHQAMFATFQALFWLLLLVSLLLLIRERMRLYALGLVGVIYIFELHHIIKALLSGGYYPGLITSLVFPVIAYFFWQEFIRNYRIVK
ncbi:MAG: HXXEE domain-containing protein [Minisyncoccota bacterium]